MSSDSDSGGEVAPLPKGWIEKKDKEGKSYYKNAKTRVSTYSRPPPDDPTAAKKKASSSDEDVKPAKASPAKAAAKKKGSDSDSDAKPAAKPAGKAGPAKKKGSDSDSDQKPAAKKPAGAKKKGSDSDSDGKAAARPAKGGSKGAAAAAVKAAPKKGSDSDSDAKPVAKGKGKKTGSDDENAKKPALTKAQSKNKKKGSDSEEEAKPAKGASKSDSDEDRKAKGKGKKGSDSEEEVKAPVKKKEEPGKKEKKEKKSPESYWEMGLGSYEGSYKEGEAQKSNPKGKLDRRYFVLFNDKLKYFKKKGDKKEKGDVPLPPGFALSEVDMPGKYVFSVGENGDENTRQFLLYFDDEATKTAWWNALYALSLQKGVKKFPDSLMEGYLTKQGATGGKWNKRFFTLFDDRLDYYKKFADKKPCGSCELKTKNILLMQAKEGGSKHLFKLAPDSDPTTRAYAIVAPTDDIMTDWMEAIAKVVKNKPGFQMDKNSIKEGYCKKSSGQVKTRKFDRAKEQERYFVLLQDRLVYYKHRTHCPGKSVGDIELKSNTILEEQPDGDSTAFIVVAHQRARKMYKLQCNTVDETDAWIEAIRQVVRLLDGKRTVPNAGKAAVAEESDDDSEDDKKKKKPAKKGSDDDEAPEDDEDVPKLRKLGEMKGAIDKAAEERALLEKRKEAIGNKQKQLEEDREKAKKKFAKKAVKQKGGTYVDSDDENANSKKQAAKAAVGADSDSDSDEPKKKNEAAEKAVADKLAAKKAAASKKKAASSSDDGEDEPKLPPPPAGGADSDADSSD